MQSKSPSARRTLFALVCLLALGLTAQNAAAGPITLGDPLASPDPLFVGWYHPPEPADPADEVGYINQLISLGPGEGPDDFGTDFTYDRVASELPGYLPMATLAGAIKNDSPVLLGEIDVSGFTYLVGKYDGRNAGALVWLVSGIEGPVVLPAEWGPPTSSKQDGPPTTTKQYELSHYSLYRSVPDGGATLTLLGAALAGLVALRRKSGA